MNRWVEITFDCVPLRTIARLDIPIDASPKYQQKLERIKQAIERHGRHNSYYLHNARCTYHLANSDELGTLEFTFEGTVITDENDRKTQHADLRVELLRETCAWLTQPVVAWFEGTVEQSVKIEFDRYIAAGDLEQTRRRIERMQQEADAAGGYVGLYL